MKKAKFMLYQYNFDVIVLIDAQSCFFVVFGQ